MGGARGEEDGIPLGGGVVGFGVGGDFAEGGVDKAAAGGRAADRVWQAVAGGG